MKQLSFRNYIKGLSQEGTPAGDFIRDAKQAPPPDVSTWKELETWLRGQVAIQAAIDAGKEIWKRYETARDGVQVELGYGLTVAGLLDLLKKENPEAHVIMFNRAKGPAANRVHGYSKVSIKQGDDRRELPAIMLE